MNYLLDTCVISEIIRPSPSKKVEKWIQNEDEMTFFISVITFGEIHKGIEKLPKSTKKQALHNWVENDLKERFQKRIINIDLKIAMAWGKVQAMAEKAGKPMPAIDALIAATGIVHHLTVVTRNVMDLRESGVALLNPWE